MKRLSGNRWTFGLVGVALAAILLLGALAMGGLRSTAGVPAGVLIGSTDGKIAKQVLEDTEGGQSASVVVMLKEQADLSKAYAMRNHDERGWYVYNTLREHAASSQAPLKAFLASRGVPYTSFWVANMLVLSADRSLVQELAQRSDVRIIESNRPSKWTEDFNPISTESPQVVEWGVQRVNAPQVWAMGYTGQNIVVANQDTGMRWSHNAIKPKYRGWNGSTADHNYNWRDAIHSGGGSCGPNSQAPCDDNGHGTHTMGTVVGDDGGANQVGVAPGARWIGCRNMNVGIGTPATYTECFQFFLAPTDLNGQNANPALRPHVMNNSWTCPPSEGCAATTLQAIVESSQAAGIFVEASAGNSGSGCSSVSDPPAIYAASFSTGAIDINNALAGFSSRGPVTSDGSGRRKPDISAPGVNVRSSTSTSDTSYGNSSGTSMAGPHVVGVVALLWSARPELTRMITETKQVLQNTANPNVTVSNGSSCGGTPIPNNHFGYGRIDALAAVNSVGGGTPTVAPTNTQPAATATSTRTNTPTNTSVPTNTPGGPTNTPVTATATATACAIQFTDVDSNHTFYPFIRCLACRNIINGYTTGCPSGNPCFRPENNVTRGQVAKIVSNAAGFSDPITNQSFEDVPVGSTFHEFVGRLAMRGIVGGYACGGPGEPCMPPLNLPYFRPNANVTRGQLAKMDSEAAGYSDVPSGQQFEDVAQGSTFYTYTYRLAIRTIMSGYACGGTGEPCNPPLNLPYFRPGNPATRGQTAKIVANTFYPNCQTPQR